jgi:hypothetical protein
MRVPIHYLLLCRVVDNFGDIGVAWRLARQLVAEEGAAVTLAVDRLEVFARIAPQVRVGLDEQIVSGVRIWPWGNLDNLPKRPFDGFLQGINAVAELFACETPQALVEAMAAQVEEGKPAPAWLNLEYMSAEDWVEGVHGLRSPHARLPLTKTFFCPGFAEKTGGLLREWDALAHLAQTVINRGLAAKTDAVTHGGAVGDESAMHGARGVEPRDVRADEDSTSDCATVSIPSAHPPLNVFYLGYPSGPLVALAEHWQSLKTPISCAFPEGWPEEALSMGGSKQVTRGALRLRAVPFVPQEAFDVHLRVADINFVRGEDSLVRALWAGQPFVWHIYVQEDAAHAPKLDALLKRMQPFFAAEAWHATRRLWLLWNGLGDLAGGADAEMAIMPPSNAACMANDPATRSDIGVSATGGTQRPEVRTTQDAPQTLAHAWDEWLAVLPQVRAGVRAFAYALAQSPGLTHQLHGAVVELLDVPTSR